MSKHLGKTPPEVDGGARYHALLLRTNSTKPNPCQAILAYCKIYWSTAGLLPINPQFWRLDSNALQCLNETATWKRFGSAVVPRSLPSPDHRQGRCYLQRSRLIILHRQGLVVLSWEITSPMTYKYLLLNFSNREYNCSIYLLLINVSAPALSLSVALSPSLSFSLFLSLSFWRRRQPANNRKWKMAEERRQQHQPARWKQI